MWSTTSDVREFQSAAGAVLLTRAVEDTLLLTVAASVAERGPRAFGAGRPLFGWHASGAAFVWTPPFPLLLGGRITETTAAELAERLDRVGAVNSTDYPARAFADAWCRRTGGTARLGRRSRLYRLHELVPPAVDGQARLASPGDRDLLISWLDAFSAETGEHVSAAGEIVDARLRHGGFSVWEVDGTAVAAAGAHPAVGGVVRVGPVYTPPAARGHGYGSAVTAAVSAAARPHHAVLFTDLGNPTSNSIYQKIGYRPVEDRQIFEF